MFKLGSVDIGTQFEGMAENLKKIYDVVNTETKSGIEITHTLENLALITSGTSAQSSSGLLSGIMQALKGWGSSMEATLTLDAETTEKFLSKGTAKTMAQIKDGIL